jgi:hypothetical protein
MKLRRTPKGNFTFQLSAREQQRLFEIIRLYPLVPASHHRLTRTALTPSDENQRLLETSLAEQRAENRRQIEALLRAPERLRKVAQGFHLQLTTGELDWLLQILNDIRVGSWLALGEPDENKPPELTPENFHYALAMEVSGLFQSVLLAGLGETESSEWLE